MKSKNQISRTISSLTLVVLVAFFAIGCSSVKEPRGILTIGRTDCIPCQKMMGFIEEINSGEYSDVITGRFIDASEDYSALEKYGVDGFPTTIFFDENGEEFHRQLRLIELPDIYEKFGIKVEDNEK